MDNEASSSHGSIKNRGESVVVDVGRRRSSCGYCKSVCRSSISHGMWAHSLTVDDYQDLLDHGWRRSGCFVYKPEMETTCCPAYTIRLKAGDYVPSKEQLRVYRRMQRFLDGAFDGRKHEEFVNKSSSQGCISEGKSSKVQSEGKNQEEEYKRQLSEKLDVAVHSCIKNGDLPCGIQFPRDTVRKLPLTKRKRLAEGSEDLLYTSNVSFQIAANLRRKKEGGNDSCDLETSKRHAEGSGISFEVSPKYIAEKLASSCQGLLETPHLSVRACSGHINFYSAVQHNSLEKERPSAIPSNNTHIQHGNAGKHKTFEQSPIKKRKLEIKLQRSSFDPEEYKLYRKYQIKVHNDAPDQVTESSYTRFLVDSPLVYVPPTGDDTVPPCGFGSFHQQYVVDGQLIAVGVIDILPQCLSSKYLFWDPDFAFLSLGKYSALQEISWIKDNKCFCPSLQFYYLGYYIHSCSKMRYKAAYNPSELLCPLRYKWIPFSVAKPLLDRKRYAILSDPSNSQNEESSLLQEPEDLEGPQQDDESFPETADAGPGDVNDLPVNRDEMVDSDSEPSDDESFPETADLIYRGTEDCDVGKVLIGLKGSHVRYEDLRQAIGGPVEALEDQLSRYVKVVGSELSQRMVYLIT